MNSITKSSLFVSPEREQRNDIVANNKQYYTKSIIAQNNYKIKRHIKNFTVMLPSGERVVK